MKILFAGMLGSESTARHRMNALTRIGHEVVPFDFSDYLGGLGRISNWAYHRALSGPRAWRMNCDLRAAAGSAHPDIILIDKGVFVAPSTVRYLSERIGVTVQHNLDNPFGSMGEKSWRLLIAAIPLYDIHFVPREINLQDYQAAGAKQAIRVPLAFEPTVHYPPPPEWNEANRVIDVSYTGAPYDDRAEFIGRLLTDHGIAVDVRGNRWDRQLPPEIARRIYAGPSVYNEAYRRRFWDSKLCLAFVTRSNRDQVAHKSFEIAASGGVLLAEATAEHRAAFEDGKEALFFTDTADCARLIREYLPRPEARAAIARAGRRRAIESGYSNDDRLRKAIEEVRIRFRL